MSHCRKARRASATSSGLSSTSSTSLFTSSLPWNAEEEGRTRPGLGIGPYATAVALHDAADDGEPHAMALEFLPRVQAFEDAEELLRLLGVESDAVVPHVIDAIVLGLVAADLDARGVRVLAELERVRQEVEDDQAHHRVIGLARRQLVDLQLDVQSLGRGREIGEDALDGGVHLDGLGDHLL